MIKVILGLVLAVVLSSLAFGMQTPSAYAIKTINEPTGGDCTSIGTWTSLTNTCTLSNDTNDGIVIGDNNITLDGNGHTISGTSGNGVLVQIKQGVTVKNLKIQNFGTGINVDNSINTILSGNTISNSQGAGISSTSSNNLVLTNNILSNNVGGITVSGTPGTTLTSNTVSNDKGSVAIMISGSSNTVLTSNTVTNNGVAGIETFSGSDGSTLTSNTVSGNGGVGVYIASSNNVVTKNTISNNGNSGIYVSAGGTQITHNTISNNLHGIDSGYASTVYDNTISGNKLGIAAGGGTYYNNNLINNAVQVSGAFASTFSLNPPTGGNYWSDYSTSAQGCDDSNYDNFCDKPYPFSGGTVGVVDNYPWTIQNGWHTVITTGGNITTSVVGNSTSKSVAYTVSATQDSSPISVNCNPTSGSLFSLGTTTVVCTASTGVKSSFGVTVAVKQTDSISPVVTVPSNQVVTATSSSGAIVNYPAATATDNVGVTSGPTCTPSSGSMFSIGNTIVTCTAGDAAGNTGKATFTVTVNAQQTATSLITANTDKSSYTFGDTILVSGTVSSVVPGTPVSIQIFDPNNSLVQTSQISVSSDGTYSNPITITGPYWTLNGIYTLTVQYGPPNIKAQTTFTFSNPTTVTPPPVVPTPSTSAITAATDRSSYSAGDSIIISGTVSQVSSVNPNQPVTIQTYDTNHELVRMDQAVPSPTGQYSIAVPAHGPMWQSTGTYTLKIQYDQSPVSELTFYFNAGTLVTPPPQTQASVEIQAGAGASASAACVASNNCFSPNPILVAPGTTVTWKNGDTVSHTITSGHVSDDNAGSLFDSGLVKFGNTFQFTFVNAGSYDYFCTVHPWMIGKVIVGSGVQPVPVQVPTIGNEVTIQAGAGASASAACVASNNCFSPNPLSVAPGTEVEWKNGDTVSHTVTSGKVSDDNPGIMFDSGLIKNGADFKYTFENAGTYDYFCTVHPWMTGQVIVGSGISTPPHLLTNPTQQDLSNINQARTNQTIAAEVNVGGDKTETKSIDTSVSVQTTSATSDSLGVKVSAPDQTGPKVIVFNLNATTINVANLKDLGVEYDGKLISPAPNMDAILHAKSTDNPSFAIVVTQSGVQVMVLVPHFSSHTITLTNMSKVIPAVPEFPFAMLALIIAIFSVVLISKIKSVRHLHTVFQS